MSATEVRTHSHRAMATYFQVALWGRDVSYLDSVAQECFEEIDRIERLISLYREDTDIFELNALGSKGAVTLDPRVFALMQEAARLSEETGGAFDPTVGPLVRAWGFLGGSGEMPDPETVEEARHRVGIRLVGMDPADRSAWFLRDGVMVDLGAIGKGYALQQVAELIREYEVPGGLVHGGTSTVAAVGGQTDGEDWSVAIQDPADDSKHLSIVNLRDNALSVSAVHGKYFIEGHTRFGHVIDPRSGQPVQNAVLAAVVCPSAAESDALSTALLVDGEGMLESLARRPKTSGMVAVHDSSGNRAVTAGDAFRLVQ